MFSERADLPPIDHAARVEVVTSALRDSGAGHDAWLVTDLTDIRWLTGFDGSNAWLVIRPTGVTLGTDGRYGDRARAETASSGVTVVAEQSAAELQDAMYDALEGVTGVGLDERSTTMSTWSRLASRVPVSAWESFIKVQRQVKEPAEIVRIEHAAEIADAALAEVEAMLLATPDHPMTELDVRMELEYRMIKLGADDRSYDTIVASGPEHGARPHHGATRRTIVEGDTVIIDVGALVDGYHSDMTRSWVIGDATVQQREVYDLVFAAQQAGLDATAAGMPCRDIDAACRQVFADAGYLDWYLHGTGHGVGLDIHETPFHAPTSPDTILRDYVVTVEPGLYRVGFGGFRIEDLVVVTETGHRVLTHSPKRPLA